jgi:hypothetical protein
MEGQAILKRCFEFADERQGGLLKLYEIYTQNQVSVTLPEYHLEQPENGHRRIPLQ